MGPTPEDPGGCMLSCSVTTRGKGDLPTVGLGFCADSGGVGRRAADLVRGSECRRWVYVTCTYQPA